MKVSRNKTILPAVILFATMMIAGCPLPFDYSGQSAGSSHSTDPSTPSMTAAVTVSYSEVGGTSGTIANEGDFVSGRTTTVTLSTETANSVIYYTDDGSDVTFSTAKKITGSSGQFTISKGTSVETLEIHAVAIGPNRKPSQAAHATVSVSPYPVITVTCDKASINEVGGTATFTITSSMPPGAPIVVNLVTGGGYATTALSGLGASGSTFTRTIAQSTTTVTVPIAAVLDSPTDDNTVTLTIQPDIANTPPAYSVGSPKTAQVVILDDKAHYVTYNGNGNTSGTVPVDGTHYPAGATVTVAGPGTLAKSGYAFTGWVDPTGTYRAGDHYAMGSTNVTLTAVWAPTYAVTYNGAGNTGGTAPTDSNRYQTGATVTLANPGSLTRTGYTFAWWTDAGGYQYNPGSTMTIGSADVALSAVWTAIPYSVTYYGNGNTSGAAPVDATVYHIGDTVTVSNQGSLANDSGFFVGWNTLPDGTGTTYNPGYSFPMGAANVTLYAMWAVVSGGTITSIPPNVTNVVIPSGITTIPGPDVWPFQGHTKLLSVTIPATVTSIPAETFMGCTQLTTFSSSGRYQVFNGALVDTSGGGTLLAVPAGMVGSFTIPSVTSIALYAFDGCKYLTNINIPASLTTISANAFSGIESSIALYLPSTVTSISAYTFTYSSFTTIDVPASVTSIGDSAMYGCSNLTAVYMASAVPPTLGGTLVFKNSPVTVHVPDAAAVTAYKADVNWAGTGVAIVSP